MSDKPIGKPVVSDSGMRPQEETCPESEPWPLADVLLKLGEAANHLLHDHDCDCHGHELIAACRDRAFALASGQPVVPQEGQKALSDAEWARRFGAPCDRCGRASQWHPDGSCHIYHAASPKALSEVQGIADVLAKHRRILRLGRTCRVGCECGWWGEERDEENSNATLRLMEYESHLASVLSESALLVQLKGPEFSVTRNENGDMIVELAQQKDQGAIQENPFVRRAALRVLAAGWAAVERGEVGSRSPLGDALLDLRDELRPVGAPLDWTPESVVLESPAAPRNPPAHSEGTEKGANR